MFRFVLCSHRDDFFLSQLLEAEHAEAVETWAQMQHEQTLRAIEDAVADNSSQHIAAATIQRGYRR